MTMTMEKESFLNQVRHFIHELRNLFPQDRIFPVADYTIKLYASTKPNELIHTFKDYLEQYKSSIQKKDEDFFLSETYDFNNSSYTDQIISRLKVHWSTLDQKNKDTIWLYLSVLLKLSEKCT